MYLKSHENYMKYNETTIKIMIPKMLLLVLLQQINRYLEVLKYGEEVIDNFAIYDNINGEKDFRM